MGEKTGFKKIKKLLEISKRERHHEILLTVKNLRELSRNPSPYTLPVIPRHFSNRSSEWRALHYCRPSDFGPG